MEPINFEFTVSMIQHKIKKVIVSDNVTVVLWSDGSKTRATCAPEDTFDPKIGIAQCLLKKSYGKKKIVSLINRIEYHAPKAQTVKKS
jgi:hypothetical protein